MKKIATILAASALLALLAGSAFAANAVRISQVFGGGGAATANTDYVEIFNSSASPVAIGGWAIEYGSATGLWNSFTGNAFVFPASAVIQPCSYVLLACSKGTAVVTPLVSDYSVSPTTVFNMSGTSGKVMLITQLNDSLAAAPPGTKCGFEVGILMDKVGYGPTTVCSEVSPAPILTASTATFRANGGLTDTDNNSVDFVGGAPAPRNSQSAANPGCQTVPTTRGTWGQLKSLYR